MRSKVLVLCHDTVGAKMAGPGIRYQNIAQQLSKVSEVTLAVFSDTKTTSLSGDISVINSVNDTYQQVFDDFDIIFAQWLSLDMLRYAKAGGKKVIIDLYAPVPIEYLASLGFSDKKLSEHNDLEFSGIIEMYKHYLTLGDFFVCSNERQRDFWLGYMTSLNIIKPTNFNSYKEQSRLALSPMGISSTPALSTSLKLRKKIGLAKDDFVLLWTGGIWDWFDSLTVIRAMDKVKSKKVKLVFLGTQHPNSKVAEMSESKAARALAKKLGVENKNVFFLDGWVDYETRADYLLDADVAIYADKDSVETRFSHRTRVLDHIWVGLPTICTKGDYLSSEVERLGMGVVVPERNPEAFSKAINTLYDSPELIAQLKANIAETRADFTWEVLTADLIDYVRNNSPNKNDSKLAASTVQPIKSTTRSRKALRRVKNAARVLLGRADV